MNTGSTVQASEGEEHEHESRDRTFLIHVNKQQVVMHSQSATGAQIKAAAIAQQVNIAADFLLFIVEPGNQLDPVADFDPVDLHQHKQFRACAPDDNS